MAVGVDGAFIDAWRAGPHGEFSTNFPACGYSPYRLLTARAAALSIDVCYCTRSTSTVTCSICSSSPDCLYYLILKEVRSATVLLQPYW